MNFVDRAIAWLGTGKTGVAFFCVCVLAGVLLIASALLPYRPLTVRSMTVVPSEVCLNAGVEIRIDRTWERPSLWHSVDEVEVTSVWEEVSTGARYPAITATAEPDYPPFSGEVRSSLVREAPAEAGVYALQTTYAVKGRTLLLGSYQDLGPVVSNDVAIVESEVGGDCAGTRSANASANANANTSANANGGG